MDIGLVAAVILIMALCVHWLSIAIATARYRKVAHTTAFRDPVTIIRPVCGVDQYDRGTLASSFWLTHPDYELIFCCARSNDPAVALVEELIARHPRVDARLLVGDERPSANPKLNNVAKGWKAARHPWIVLADSNVIMPPDYVDQLAAAWHSDTGLVCSPPLGCLPHGFWAEIECAFLNTYQSRWQTAADSVGFGFAQGKSMLWRRELLEQAGGIEALGAEIAEDAAATKIVRARGKRVRLVDRPFEQPLGTRTASQVLARQLRWAKLRRATFVPYYLPELLTGSLPALAAAAVSALAYDVFLAVAMPVVLAAWYLPEAVMNRRAGWHFTWKSPLAWVVRDALIPVVWMGGWIGNGFTWRGNDMSVSTAQVDCKTMREVNVAPGLQL